MSCTVRFFLLNDDFSQEYADLHNNGQESELNKKFQWEDELEVTVKVTGIKSKPAEIYKLQGSFNDQMFEYEVLDMHLFEMESDEGSVVLGCSEKLLEDFQIDINQDSCLNVYLKDREPFSNPVPGIYIAAKDFPKELLD